MADIKRNCQIKDKISLMYKLRARYEEIMLATGQAADDTIILGEEFMCHVITINDAALEEAEKQVEEMEAEMESELKNMVFK